MGAFINYFLTIVNKVVSVLNVKIFSDMPITYLQLLLGAFLIPYLINFIFVGFKEVEKNTNLNYFEMIARPINNNKRKNQINQTFVSTTKVYSSPKYSERIITSTPMWTKKGGK